MMKKTFRLFLATFTFLLSAFAVASGTMNLEGKLHAFNKDTIEIEDQKKIYVIKKSLIGEQQNTKIKSLKIGENVFLVVPFEAMEHVKLKQ